MVSTFAQRFEFSRDRQRALGIWQDDQSLAALLDLSGGQITDYKSREEAPPAKRVLQLARIMGVDPGWLAFGEDTQAAAPDGFGTWLTNRRAPQMPASKFERTDVAKAAKKKRA